jgi:hypothetical protein
MTLRKKIGIVAAALVLTVVIALEMFLHTGLHSMLQPALDRAREAFGAELRIDNAAASLFGGKIRITGVEADNAGAFREPHWLSAGQCRIDLAISALMKGTVRLSDVRVDDLTLVVEKNPDGKTNLLKLAQKLQTIELPEIILDHSSFDTLIEYVDYNVPGQPLRLPMELAVEAHDISAFNARRTNWGSFKIKGHLQDNPESFIVDLHGRIAPLTDTAKPTLELGGDILAIDMNRITQWAEPMGIDADAASVAVRLQCVDGRYRGTGSELTVRLIKPRLAGELARKAGPVALPAELVIRLPVYGTLDEARRTFTEKLSQVALDCLKNEIEAASKALTEEAKETQAALDAALKRLQQTGELKP